eukprot:gene16273-18435_t
MNQLKEAERKATQLVQDARKQRTDRLKEAKTEAEKIVSDYRAEQEALYKDALNKVNAKANTSGNELQNSTNNDISTLNREFASKKDGVEQMLIDLVLKVDLKPPAPRR